MLWCVEARKLTREVTSMRRRTTKLEVAALQRPLQLGRQRQLLDTTSVAQPVRVGYFVMRHSVVLETILI